MGKDGRNTEDALTYGRHGCPVVTSNKGYSGMMLRALNRVEVAVGLWKRVESREDNRKRFRTHSWKTRKAI